MNDAQTVPAGIDTGPSERWARVRAYVAEATRADALMAAATNDEVYDDACGDYVSASDALVTELAAMDERGQLLGISELLAVTYGRV